ncbi:hypothetical protein ACVWWN_002195 [Mycobacterium sp. URHB0021]
MSNASEFTRIFEEGKDAFPETLECPYAGDRSRALVWRKGWHTARDERHGSPSAPETIEQMGNDLSDLQQLADELGKPPAN